MRLIDADKLLEIISKTRFPEWVATRGIVVSMPTVDAVPVVRCKDCVYANENIDPLAVDYMLCSMSGVWCPMDGYCQDGVRKESRAESKDIESIKSALAETSEICRTHRCAECPLRYIDKESEIPMCPFSDDDNTFPPMNWKVNKY